MTVGVLAATALQGHEPLAAVPAAGAVVASIVRTSRDGSRLAETRRQAPTDELTGLPNRRAFTLRSTRRSCPAARPPCC
ncbi:MAG TPA: hypothetical protein VN213_16260 [Solirubrobacteraceae bacterium]|nr:hypothetical protein [Solirubrobacteraceae bacterium]